MSSAKVWAQANQNLIAKSLGELSYEGLLNPVCESGDKASGTYRIDLKSGVTYSFHAWCSVWGFLRVSPTSVERWFGADKFAAVDAAQFFIDAQAELEMTDIILGNFIEEMHSTLYSDMDLLLKNSNIPSEKLADMNGIEIQSYLNGHPKILLNKGRMGWGATELAQYAPESQKAFQLHWIAVSKKKTVSGLQEGLGFQDLYESSLSESALAGFHDSIRELGQSPDDYYLMPTHPWQWNRILKIQFAGEIARNEIITLGVAGDSYLPQISIRTLSNASRPTGYDIKLPLTILNTSAIRGIPSRSITSAPAIAKTISRICQMDPILSQAHVQILEEKAGLSFQNKSYSKIPGTPYRYKETLGVIWRESAESKLNENEVAIITGSLFHQDQQGRSLIGAYIRKSGLSITKWLECYFDHVVIPLYHLQLKYQIGLVAHGQNIVLKMTNFIPSGVFLKDFQGDLRISNQIENDHALSGYAAHLDQLPPEYLIHDLITGHLLTVLRFVSATLQESDGFSEKDFYGILSGRIQHYLNQNFPGDLDSRLNLLNPKIHRVLLNKVRFKVGYADSSERPKPMLGVELRNPLVTLEAP